MDGVRLNGLIYRGMGRAAVHIGTACDVFRPLNSTSPLANQVDTLSVAFNAADPKYAKPNLYGKPVWFADMDGTSTQGGDYLVRQSDNKIWFIAAQQQLLPIVAIDCNRSIRITRQGAATSVGALGYSGIIAPGDILGSASSLWPCSILTGGRGQRNVGLPADVKDAGWRILLPPSVPIAILAADLAVDDMGRGFAIDSAELTDLGWRLSAAEVHP